MSGQSIGALVGGLAGAAIGSVFGMTAVGWMVGSTLGGVAGGMMDPTVIQQPGLNDKKLQTSQYGVMLPYVWGRFRLAGTVDWIGNNGELVEHSSSSGGKGGGAQVEKKSYTGSWSIKYNKSTRAGEPALAAIDKHWADGRVVVESDINPTLYIGNKEQLPDSSMEADLGVGEVSADRFIGKEVYNEVQMEQFYNRIPQMEALLRTVSASNGPITQLANEEADVTWPLYPRITSWAINLDDPENLPLPTAVTDPMYYWEGAQANRSTRGGIYKYADGTTLDLWFNYCLHPCPVGGMEPGEGPWPYSYDMPQLGAGNASPIGTSDICYAAGVEVGRIVYGWATTQDGSTLIVQTTLDGDDPMWHRIVDGTVVDEGPIATSAIHPYGILLGAGNNGDNIASMYKSVVEPDWRYIWTTYTAGYYDDDTETGPAKSVALYYIDPADDTLKSYDAGSLGESLGGPGVSTDKSGAIFCPGVGYCAVLIGAHEQYALYTRLAGSGVVTLAEIVSDVFELKPSSVGDLALTPLRYDVSAAASFVVHGAAFNSQMQKRNFLAMLEQYANFDIVESDDGVDSFLKLVFRGGAPVAEIPDEDLGVHDDGDAPKPLLELVSRMQDWELPARVNVSHYDPDQEYQIGSQFAQRAWPFVDNVTRIDLPIVMSKDHARNIAKRELYRAHLERDTYGWSTSRKWAYLEPTDVVTIQGRDLRILKKTETPTGVIRWEGVLSAPFIDEQVDDAPPAEGTTPNPGSGERVDTKFLLLDVPLRTDADSDYAIKVAMGPIAPGSWKGASLLMSADGGTTFNEVATTNVAATMGTANTALQPWALGYLTDYASWVEVTVENGRTLESVNEEALSNGANLCLIGNEFLQFGTAELVAASVYRLSMLVRGRRGTEMATSHAIGDQFVLLDTCVEVPLTAAQLGVPLQYKAVSYGKPIASGTVRSFTNTGVALREYAPADLAGGVNPGGDIAITWKPRVRRGGEWNDFVDVRLRAQMDWVLEIWDATYTFCARVVVLEYDPRTFEYVYTEAMQRDGFGAAQARVYDRLCLLGDNGAGSFARFNVAGLGATEDDPIVSVPPYVGGPSFPDPPPPGNPIPPVDVVITALNNNYHTTGLTIGQKITFGFTTRATPAISGAYLQFGEYQDEAWTRVCRVRDATGALIAETGGTQPRVYFGTLPNSASYTVELTAEYGGLPSGPIGEGCDVILYINGVF